MTDAEVVKGIFSGETKEINKALEVIYKSLRTSAIAYAYAKGLNVDVAEDLLHDAILATFLNIKQNRYNYDSTSKLSPYIYSVYRNMVRVEFRKRAKLNTYDELAELDDSIVDQSTNEDEEEYRELNFKALNLAIKSLSVRCQAILNDFYVEDLSIRNIAERYSLNEDGVRIQRFRCMKYLRLLFEEEKRKQVNKKKNDQNE